MGTYGNEETLCLYDDNAKPFLKNPVGTKMTLTVEAILTSAGLEADPEGNQTPCVEFTVVSVDGKKKSYDDYSNSEMEQEIYDVMNGAGAEAAPQKPDSIFKQMKQQESLGKAPFPKSNKPVTMR